MSDTLITILFSPLFVVGMLFCYWLVKEGENVKKQYYDGHYHLAINPLGDNPITESEAFTKEEESAYQILSQTKRDSLWGEVIGRTLAKGSVTEFRELIRQLKSQANDCPDTMIKIIGVDGYRSLMNISHNH